MAKKEHYWFERKRGRYGWGAPLSWQGWLITDLALLVAVSDLLGFITATPKGFWHEIRAVITFGIILAADVAAFRHICLKKGESER